MSNFLNTVEAAQCDHGHCYHSVNVINQLKLFESQLSILQSTNLRAFSVNVIIRLMLSVSVCPKVIPLSGFHCSFLLGVRGCQNVEK
jgi:hypothetical protein